MSIIDPLTCGFAKTVAHDIWIRDENISRRDGESQNHFISRVYSKKYEDYCKAFANCNENFTVTYKTFINNFPKI